jgi:hypothetical protein
LAVEFELSDGVFPTSSVLQSWRQAIPTGLALGEQLYQNGDLKRMQAEGWNAAQMVTALSKLLSR